MLALTILLLAPATPLKSIDARVNQILAKMTLQEKLGQMSQDGIPDPADAKSLDAVRHGRYGSLYGFCSAATRADFQNAARHSRLGIPLVFGCDVIHGYATGLPIPLGQAASFDPDLVRACSRISAAEAAGVGIQWAFAPMMDIARDPRWGRIAEGYGEDRFLASSMAVATMRGYQGAHLDDADSLAACGKHYVGYGAAEGGRDYNSTWIPENLLRDVYLKPYEACVHAGIASLMSAFNAINGVPASGNSLTLRQILRNEWHFDGMVVSDFEAIDEMIAHGYAADGAEAALKGIKAGVDMEMVSRDYWKYGAQLVKGKKLDIGLIDNSVRNILRMKFRLGLFDSRKQPLNSNPAPTPESRAMSRKLAEESLVLLKNEHGALPLSTSVGKVAVIGPLANQPGEQLGSWSSADSKYSVTPLEALKLKLGSEKVLYAPGIVYEPDHFKNYEDALHDFLTSKDQSGFPAAIAAASQADVVLVFLGEIANVSGEASSRASLDLPGAQAELVSALAKTGKPVIGIVMAGRPLTMTGPAAEMSALLFAWSPGTMAGPAIVDTVFGDVTPSGKLPVTFPRSVGQVPIYYDHLSTGRPYHDENFDHYTSRYLDIPVTPEYPFGFGLSYTKFSYSPTRVRRQRTGFVVSADISNIGKMDGDEIVELYTHQMVASVARPVRELKGFRRIHLRAGETKTIEFLLNRKDLAFWNQQMKYQTEPGKFEVWIAPDCVSGTVAKFELK